MGIFDEEKKILVCPNCGHGSLEPIGDLSKDKPQKGSGISGEGIGPRTYHCRVCGYSGPAVISTSREAKDIRDELKDFKKVGNKNSAKEQT